MIAGLNRTRRELNDRARQKLQQAGRLGDECVVANGRDFRVGDWVVARQNKQFIRDGRTVDLLNGSTGSVTNIAGNALTVEFEREGSLTLPFWYLNGAGLDHAYARTTYGVQGKTMDNALYQPTDVSSFEEGYVAITRGKSSTRVYMPEFGLAGTALPAWDDDGWREVRDEAIRTALGRKRAKSTAHEADVDLPGF